MLGFIVSDCKITLPIAGTPLSNFSSKIWGFGQILSRLSLLLRPACGNFAPYISRHLLKPGVTNERNFGLYTKEAYEKKAVASLDRVADSAANGRDSEGAGCQGGSAGGRQVNGH